MEKEKEIIIEKKEEIEINKLNQSDMSIDLTTNKEEKSLNEEEKKLAKERRKSLFLEKKKLEKINNMTMIEYPFDVRVSTFEKDQNKALEDQL
jgi:hypothetical protein